MEVRCEKYSFIPTLGYFVILVCIAVVLMTNLLESHKKYQKVIQTLKVRPVKSICGSEWKEDFKKTSHLKNYNLFGNGTRIIPSHKYSVDKWIVTS